jgi:hypothetical protein
LGFVFDKWGRRSFYVPTEKGFAINWNCTTARQ